MSDLFQLVRDHIEATDQITQEWQTAEGPKTLTRSFSRPVAWIEKVHERGVLTALDCLSIIFFALDDWHALPTREQEIQLAEGWAAELRQAAHAGEIQARDPFTLLPLTNTPEGWDWGLSTSDADRFLAARGMSWRCGEIASHIYNEVASEIEAKRFPPFLDKSAHSTAAPVEADSASDAPDWTVSKPQRYNGYTAPLHRLLAAAHRDGNPCPTARDVVEAWRNNAPAEIAKVLPDGFDYYDAKGNTKTADLEAIRKAIGRMTIAR